MCQQHNGLISYRERGEHMFQDGLPLPLVWKPGDGGRNRDEATLLPTHAFANRIDGIMSMAQTDRPTIKAAQGADVPPDRRRRKLRTSQVGNVASVGFVSRSSLCVSRPEPINILSNLIFICLKEIRKWNVRKSGEKIIEISMLIGSGRETHSEDRDTKPTEATLP